MPREPLRNYDAPKIRGESEDPQRWHSFSGADLECVIRINQTTGVAGEDTNNSPVIKKFAELQTVSVSGARSVHPVRRLGQSQPTAYTRGARTIGGSLVFTQFSTDALWEVMRLSRGQETFSVQEPFHTDQLPEFDLIITGANEYGVFTNAIIGGITITNFGTTLSIHDIYTEVSYTYVARFYMPFAEEMGKMDLLQKLTWAGNVVYASQVAAKAVTKAADEKYEAAKAVMKTLFAGNE